VTRRTGTRETLQGWRRFWCSFASGALHARARRCLDVTSVSRCAVRAEVFWACHKDEWRHVFGGSGEQVRWSRHVFWGSSKPSWEAPVVEHEINGTLMAEPCHEGQRQQSLGSSGGLGTMSCETRANIVREAPVAAEVFARVPSTLDGLAWRDGGCHGNVGVGTYTRIASSSDIQYGTWTQGAHLLWLGGVAALSMWQFLA